MKKIIYILTIIFNLVISSAIFAQEKEDILTQQEFIDIVIKYHPIVKQADINIEKAKADILIAKGEFDPNATASIAQKTFDGIDYYNSVNPEIRIPTWYGIELIAGAENLSGTRNNQEETIGQTSYAGIVVPLAKNLLIDKRRAALQTAKVFKTLSEIEKRSILNDLLLQATKTYWDWAYQYQQMTILKNLISVNEKRFNLIKISFRQGDKPALDTTEALTQLQTFQYLQQEATLLFKNATLDLNTFLWKEDQEAFSLPDIIVPDSIWITENIADKSLPILEELVKQSRLAHPDIQQYNFKIEALTIDRKLKFQDLLPKIDFKYNQLGKGYNILNAKSGVLFDNNFQYGINVGIPLRLSKGRGEYKKAKLKINETALNRNLKTVLIENKIKANYNELLTLRSQFILLEKSFSNFQTLQRGEELKFFNGESSLFLVNSRENKSLEAMQKLLKTKTEYYKAFNNLLWASGVLN